MSLKWLAMGALVVLVGCGQTGRSVGAGDDEAFEQGGEVATTETEEAEDEPELDQTEPGCDVDGDGFEAIACGGTDCRIRHRGTTAPERWLRLWVARAV